MKKWNALMLAVLLGASFLAAPLRAAGDVQAPAAKAESVVESTSVKQLRGKLLYKRNQIRKLERAAAAADAEIGGKVAGLEKQIQALYVAADPKLEALYQAEKELVTQIEEATPKK